MRKKTIIILTLFISLVGLSVYAQTRPTKKKVVYRSFTQLDFSGETVQGKIRAPEVFYIFQRKRSAGHQITHPPKNFNHHRSFSVQILKEAIP